MRDNTALAGVLLAGAVLLGVYAASGNSSASRDSGNGTRIDAPLTDVQIDRDKTLRQSTIRRCRGAEK